MWQVSSQPSPLNLLPSSQASPSVTMPLPHAVTVQLESQGSPSSAGSHTFGSPARQPSSHSSLQSTTLLPHLSSLHVLVQPSHEMRLPSSQPSQVGLTSPGAQLAARSRMPLPQPGSVQLLSQASPFTLLPSSHCSPVPGVGMPLPQAVGVQLASQPSPLRRLPSSHFSSHSCTRLPHRSTVQVAEQPSHAIRLPSSHSSPASR